MPKDKLSPFDRLYLVLTDLAERENKPTHDVDAPEIIEYLMREASGGKVIRR